MGGSTDPSYTESELEGALEDMKFAAMENLFKHHGFRFDAHHRWYNSVSSEIITHDGERWHSNVPPHESVFRRSPQSIFDEYSRYIHDSFSPWRGLPLPSDFSGYAERLFDTATTNTPIVLPDKQRLSNGNSALQDSINALGEINSFSGDTMHAFRKNFTSRLPGVLTHQSNLGSLLGVALNYERYIWVKARHDLWSLIHRTRSSLRLEGDGDAGLLIAVAGSITSLAALVVTDGAAAPILGAANTGLGVLGKFIPKSQGGGDHDAQVDGNSPGEILGNAARGLTTINDWIKAHENGISTAMHDAHETVNRGHRFRLSTPGLLGADDASSTNATDPNAVIVAASDREIRIKAEDLRNLARDDLPPIAHQLEKARHQLVPATAAGIWVRHDRVGIGEHGPFPAWSSLAGRYEDLLHQTGLDVHRSADHLLTATHLLQDGDRRADAALRRHSREIHAR